MIQIDAFQLTKNDILNIEQETEISRIYGSDINVVKCYCSKNTVDDPVIYLSIHINNEYLMTLACSNYRVVNKFTTYKNGGLSCKQK